jgi:hypothetical protein
MNDQNVQFYAGFLISLGDSLMDNISHMMGAVYDLNMHGKVFF